MATTLVTGGCWFIGSHLVRALLERGDKVRVLDNLSTGRRENLADVFEHLEFMEADLADPEVARRACEGAELVFHQGAIGAVPRSIEDPRETFRVNVAGTHGLLLAARAAGVQRFVYASSSSIYGPSASLPKHELLPPDPVSPYGAQKLSSEQLTAAFARALGLETVSLRYFNVYGPRQDPHSGYAAVIPAFASRLLKGEPGRINGDGTYSRDFTYVADVVRANLLASTSADAVGHWINIAGGQRITILELHQRIAASAGHADLQPILGPERAGDIPHSLASIERAREFLGWAPEVSLADGLERTVAAYRDELGETA
jgi:UDP-glucose 4-epimerase